MYSNDEHVKKGTHGWYLRARKGKKADKNSPAFKAWFERQRITRNRTTRRKLEELAKAPLVGRVYKHIKNAKNHDQRNKTTNTFNRPTNLGV